MSLRHILLGLIDEPKSGYDIKQTFEQSLRYFWNANLAQIYPTLKKMEADGLAVSATQESDKGPDKILYKRTAAGTRELRLWLRSGPQVNNEKLHYLTQVFFLDEVPADERISFFTQLRDYFQRQLDELHAIDHDWSGDPRYPDSLPDKEQAMQFTLRLGLAKIKVIVEWCDSCLATLARHAQDA